MVICSDLSQLKGYFGVEKDDGPVLFALSNLRTSKSVHWISTLCIPKSCAVWCILM